MKKAPIITLLIAICLISLFSCKKNSPTEPETATPGTLIFYKESKLIRIDKDTIHAGPQCCFNDSLQEFCVSFADKGILFFVRSNGTKTVGEKHVNSAELIEGRTVDIDTLWHDTYRLDSAVLQHFKITKLDTINKLVSGIFYLKLKLISQVDIPPSNRKAPDFISIKNGSFDDIPLVVKHEH